VKILIVDDHFLYREGLASLLSKQDGLSVVGEAGSVCEAIEKTLELNPDLVLMDIGLPDGSGVDAATTILAHKPRTLIVMLTGYEADELLFASIRNGAVGYLLKNSPASELIVIAKVAAPANSAKFIPEISPCHCATPRRVSSPVTSITAIDKGPPP